MYERGLEHLRDFQELKPNSHMVKHFCEVHLEEDLQEMKFGCRIVKQSRTAFNRQINESVEIQNNSQHHILNSKSEYNRCALPRLSAKIGEESLKGLQQKRMEEKKQEAELLDKIRTIKVRRSFARRNQPSRKEQPAEKRRRIDKEEYKRVVQKSEEAKKREVEEDETATRPEESVKFYPIFKKRRAEMIKPKENSENTENPVEYKEKDEEELTLEEQIEVKNKEMEEENIRREERRKVAAKLSQRWELLRVCRDIMKEDGINWSKV